MDEIKGASDAGHAAAVDHTQKGTVSTGESQPQEETVVEMAGPAKKELKKFYADIDQVKATTAYVKNQANEIATLEQQAISALRQQDSQAVSDKLDALVAETRIRLASNASLLATMKEENQAAKEKSATDARIRTNLYENSVANFVAAMRLYQSAQRSYKQKMHEKIARQIHVVAPEATAEDIEAAMKSGDPGAIYRTAVLQPGSDPIKQAYAEVQSKYNDVRVLEESVIALNRMFQDMALLVEQQGAMLDQIEVHVDEAADYTVKARENVQGALKARQSSRKKMGIIFALVLIIIAIILFAIPAPTASAGTWFIVIAVILIAVALVLLWFLNPCKTLFSLS